MPMQCGPAASSVGVCQWQSRTCFGREVFGGRCLQSVTVLCVRLSFQGGPALGLRCVSLRLAHA